MFEVQTSSGMLRNTDSGNPMGPIGHPPPPPPPPPPPAHSLSSSFGLLRSNVTESGSKSFVVHVCQLANCTILGVSDVNRQHTPACVMLHPWLQCVMSKAMATWH